MNKPIKALLIFEMLGKPAEYLKEMLEEHIKSICENAGLKLINKKIHEPKQIENGEGLFSSFAEVEIEFQDIKILMNTVTFTLPSHIEIIEPEEIILNNNEISESLSDLAIKLHKYDEIAKILTLDNTKLANRVQELTRKKIKIEENIVKDGK